MLMIPIARLTLLPVLIGLLAAPAGIALAQDQGRKDKPPAGEAPKPEQPAHPGQEGYDRVCKACHGPEARGDAGPRLVPFSRGYEESLAIVREGYGQMPPISTRELSDDDVARIVEYLVALSQ
jgi:mono/diheme cytochrome c family protein